MTCSKGKIASFSQRRTEKKIRGAEAEADDAEAVVEEDIRGQVVHQRRRERRK
jgi:hypothetical protein